jgi:flagellar hook assembly protein FlgD
LTVKILDSTGRLVMTVFDAHAGQPADIRLNQDPFKVDGTNSLGLFSSGHDWATAWDGRDKDGTLVQAGIYFVQARWQKDGIEEVRTKSLEVILTAKGLTDSMVLAPNPAGSGKTPDEVSLFWRPLAAGQSVRVEIYNVAGEAVRQFEVDGSLGRLKWDLKAPSGQPAANGIYIVRVGVLSSTRELLDRRILKLGILRE